MKQVTIKDIAEIAGVSFSTVSRSLNGNRHVAASTRARIERIARDLGFEFNSSARGLITSTVGTVGIVLPDNYSLINVHVYHGMLMDNLRARLERADVDIIVTYQKNHYNGTNNTVRLVNRRKVDGLIMLVEHVDRSTLSFLESRNVPCVFVHYPPEPGQTDFDVIYTDHVAGGRLVAEHLIERGRSRLCLAAVAEPHLEFQLREEGFVATAERAGARVVRVAGDSSIEGGYNAVSSNGEAVRECDGLFALNDLMAIGAIRALRQGGRRVPADVSVVGYDNSEFGHYFEPALTSIHQPREELAVLSWDRLFHRMEKQRDDQTIERKLISIQPDLVVRQSS